MKEEEMQASMMDDEMTQELKTQFAAKVTKKGVRKRACY
jgi:hypothetical protein